MEIPRYLVMRSKNFPFFMCYTGELLWDDDTDYVDDVAADNIRRRVRRNIKKRQLLDSLEHGLSTIH